MPLPAGIPVQQHTALLSFGSSSRPTAESDVERRRGEDDQWKGYVVMWDMQGKLGSLTHPLYTPKTIQ